MEWASLRGRSRMRRLTGWTKASPPLPESALPLSRTSPKDVAGTQPAPYRDQRFSTAGQRRAPGARPEFRENSECC